MTDRLSITPQTRVSDLLEAYPELEEVLIGFAPAFAKLKNPILRRTVGKMATLEQAARIAGASVRDLVTALHQAAGGPADGLQPLGADPTPAAAKTPDWLDDGQVRETLDADAILGAGENPLGIVQRRIRELPSGAILRVTCSFRPVPLMDYLQSRGLRAHLAESGGRFEIFVAAEGGGTDAPA